MAKTSKQIALLLTDMERDTLTGKYQPFGAHASAIYEHLRSEGLWDYQGKITPLGVLVAGAISER